MSKRLQVILSDDEWARLSAVARKRRQTISDFVRECIHKNPTARLSSTEKLARISRFSRLNGPTADIEVMLAEIQRGAEE
jgi:macrodomain Ter protein organizer (MatP/YcbG family)